MDNLQRNTYCMRCQDFTENIDPTISEVKSANGKNTRKSIKSFCAICGAKKSQFIKS